MNDKRGTPDQADVLHKLVTEALIELMRDDPSPAVLDKAIKFLKDNGVTSFGGSTEDLKNEFDKHFPGPRPALPDPELYEGDEEVA